MAKREFVKRAEPEPEVLPATYQALRPISYAEAQPFRAALIQGLEILDSELGVPGSSLVSAAVHLLRQAVERGNGEALRQLADRLDGKPAQSIAVSDSRGPDIESINLYDLRRRLRWIESQRADSVTVDAG